MTAMSYKGYTARIEYTEEDDVFVGTIAGIRDAVRFSGESVKDLRKAFEEAVENYIDTCEKLGRSPQRPYSGKISLRLDSELHAAVAMKAELAHMSINQWVSDVLRRETRS